MRICPLSWCAAVVLLVRLLSHCAAVAPMNRLLSWCAAAALFIQWGEFAAVAPRLGWWRCWLNRHFYCAVAALSLLPWRCWPNIG